MVTKWQQMVKMAKSYVIERILCIALIKLLVWKACICPLIFMGFINSYSLHKCIDFPVYVFIYNTKICIFFVLTHEYKMSTFQGLKRTLDLLNFFNPISIPFVIWLVYVPKFVETSSKQITESIRNRVTFFMAPSCLPKCIANSGKYNFPAVFLMIKAIFRSVASEASGAERL